jgi:hypothetical protein
MKILNNSKKTAKIFIYLIGFGRKCPQKYE